MNLSIHAGAICRGLVTGALVLTGVSACSHRDRADTGRDTTQSAATTASPTDTSAGTVAQPSTRAVSQDTTSGEPVAAYRAMERDTATASDVSGKTSAEVGAGAAAATGAASAAGDQALTGDTVTPASEMARDTSSPAGAGAAAAVAATGAIVSTESDTAGSIQVQADTTTEQVQADTTSAVNSDTVAVASPDSATENNHHAVAGAAVVAGAAAAGGNNDNSPGNADVSRDNADVSKDNTDVSSDNAGRVRPPEDSTETMGNVTTDSTASGNVASGSESEPIRPPEDSTETRGAVTSDVGAAAMGHTVTGAEAVTLMSWGGERCIVLNEESTEARWDISDSPANLNPCGPGTMTLSPVRTGDAH